MPLDRIRALVAGFRQHVAELAPAPPGPGAWPFPAGVARDLLESMLLARHVDLAAHELRARGLGHYTICSSGHEGNVVLGHLTRTSDPALLHYRSAAFQVERARQVPGVDTIRDIALSLVAARDEPISGGRHKVFGSVPLGIVPQTSTIASHLPRAVGLAVALERRVQLGLAGHEPADAIVVTSFGDASVNHSTAQGAFNAASWVVHQMLTLPLLFVCEDNGLGVSVKTPPGWIEERFRATPHVRYVAADGWDLASTWHAADEAVRYVRSRRKPAVLHLRCERLLGHAGSDVDTVYRSRHEIAAAAAHDPVLCAAVDLVAAGVLTPADVLALDAAAAARVAEAAEDAAGRPRLAARADVARAVATAVPRGARATVSEIRAATPLATAPTRLTLAQGVNAVLAETLAGHGDALLFGEDVAKKGGVYGVTKGLFERFGPARVFNTLLDETTILGMALGAGLLGMLPIPEIQYLAYLHNAEDQLRGEAATMAFFSQGAFANPMVVRIAGLAYQKGFGGHFHNDNSLAVLRDIPGLVLVVPARADDAIALFRSAVACARAAHRVVAFVEPIALYHTRDLYAEGDGLWLAAPPAPDEAAPFGRARVYDPAAADLTIVTYGNGVHLSLRAARRLHRETGLSARVLDLRFLAPLPLDDVLEHAAATGRILVVDECRVSGNVSEALAAAVLDAGCEARFARVAAADCFVPLGDAAELVLVQEPEIVAAAKALCGATRRRAAPIRRTV